MKGSPSPAPRSWRGPGPSAGGDGKHQKTASQGSLGSSGLDGKKTRKRTQLDFAKEDTASSGSSDIDRKLSEFARKQGVTSGSPNRGSGIFSRSKVAPNMVEKGKEIIRTVHNASHGNGDSPNSKAKQDGGWLDRRLSLRKSKPGNSPSPRTTKVSVHNGPGREGPPINGVQDSDVPMERPSTVPPDYPSRTPNKSYVWDADADFTAGDVQFSTSPPVNISRTNMKLDEIAALEADALRRFPERSSFSPPVARTNTKLDEIEAREADALQRIPARTSSSLAFKVGRTNTKLDEIQARESEASRRFPRVSMSPPSQEIHTRPTRLEEMSALEKKAAEKYPKSPPLGLLDTLADLHSGNRGNHHASRDIQQSRQAVPKPDILRAREIETLSKRALATSRLDAIRERVDEPGCRSVSPEDPKRSSNESPDEKRESAPGGSRKPSDTGVASVNDKAEAVLDTVTNNRDIVLPSIEKPERDAGKYDSISGTPGQPDRDDARDFLRRLARATSSSPATEDQGTQGQSLHPKPNQAEVVKDEPRPTVGFAGLRRLPSSESLSSKRSNTETDPTDRIEGELQLFAPADNHSEKGSLRAPSPDSAEDDDDEEAEATPRASRFDLMTQPTPRVTGAYVDTPVTVKVESGSLASEVAREDIAADVESKDEAIQANGLSLAVPSFLRGRKSNKVPRKLKQTLSAKGDRVGSRSRSVYSHHRRTRSVPRVRSPLINSVKPPTVRDDLLEIQRLHQIDDSTLQIDDSTLDEFGELLGSSAPPATAPKVEQDDKDGFLDRKTELETYDRMSKSLTTGLLGIRTAKQGIERLEDKVSHNERKTKAGVFAADAVDGKDCFLCETHPHGGNITYYIPLPLPRLWHRQPRTRPTLLGLIVLLLLLWSAAESITCELYCKPQSCYSNKPCDWSPEDPLWGGALPVKLDQWIAGGAGRRLANRVGPDVVDWIADIWDAATGTDITKVDTSHYGWQQRRQHKRRLLKHGLGGVAKPFVARPEDKDKFAAWRAARLARDRVDSARDMGFEIGEDDESMGADEKVR